jgi:hypothetical protein
MDATDAVDAADAAVDSAVAAVDSAAADATDAVDAVGAVDAVAAAAADADADAADADAAAEAAACRGVLVFLGAKRVGIASYVAGRCLRPGLLQPGPCLRSCCNTLLDRTVLSVRPEAYAEFLVHPAGNPNPLCCGHDLGFPAERCTRNLLILVQLIGGKFA